MRTGKAKIRQIKPDPVYKSTALAKLINRSMKHGKKTIAQTQVYKALDIIKQKTNKSPLDAFEAAIEAITPKMQVRSRRVGGATYQVPMPVRPHRGFSLAVRWLVAESRKRPNKQFHTFSEKLAAEILDTIKGESGSLNKKAEAHKQADANKAFSHFRW